MSVDFPFHYHQRDDPLRGQVGEVALIDLYLELVVKPFVEKLLADPAIGADGRSTLLLIVDGGDGTVSVR